MRIDSSPRVVVDKIWRLLTPSQRRSSIVQAVLMIVGMGLEMLGVGLVIPLIALLTNGERIAQLPGAKAWLQWLGNPAREQLAILAMTAFMAFYVAKLAFLAFLAWRQAAFVLSIETALSQRLFRSYLAQPYTFHLQRNSAQLIRNVTTEAAAVKESLYFGIQMTSEACVLVGLGTLLLWIEPVGSLAMGLLFGGASWGFLSLTRGRVVGWGQAQQYHHGQRIQHLNQGLGSFKDIRLLGRERHFIELYDHHTEVALRVGQRQLVMQLLPRLWAELLAVTGLVALVVIILAQGYSLDAVLPTLGLFAAAAFRLMPSVTRVVNAIQVLRFGLAAIDNITAELARESPPPERVVPVAPMQETVEFRNVSFSYPDTEHPALDCLDLVIRHGESVGFIGASGAGKTTLLDLLLGLLSPSAGQVLVDGADIADNLRGWQRQIGYVPQTIYLTDDTLRRNIALGVADDEVDDAAMQRALAAAQLEDFVASLPERLDTIVGERGVRLSGGQRQRIGIARALYHDPAVLVLDEATSALDCETEEGFMGAVRALKGLKTMVIVAHRLSTVEPCDRLYRLAQGKIIAVGAPGELIAA